MAAPRAQLPSPENPRARKLEGARLEGFRGSIRGETLAPADPGYDQARAVWNGMIDRRPALIVRCSGAADVLRCVELAREHDLLVSVRGAGHHIGGKAVCDGGLVIDLLRMRGVRVDPSARTARVGAGATLGDVDAVGPIPYVAFQQALDPLLVPGARNYWKSHNFTSMPDAAIDAFLAHVPRLPSPQCELFMGTLGGAAGRVPVSAAAYPHRDANFFMNVHARWESPQDDAACTAWARQVFDAMAPYATGGTYVNFMSEDQARAAFGPNYDRLARLKRRYDPENLFRMNQNVPPAASA